MSQTIHTVFPEPLGPTNPEMGNARRTARPLPLRSHISQFPFALTTARAVSVAMPANTDFYEHSEGKPDEDGRKDHAADPPPAVRKLAMIRKSLMTAPPISAVNSSAATLIASGTGTHTPMVVAAAKSA